LALFISVERPIKNPTDVETKLQALESSTGEKIMDRLRKAYDEIYQRNTEDEPRSQELARRAYKWILCSFRTLTIDELQHAVAVDKDMTDTWVRETSGYLLDICSNFIVVDQYGNVQFAHQSVREYLEKREMNNAQEFADVEAHTQVAKTCLAFLNLSDPEVSQVTQFRGGGGFPGYAVLYWAEHCRLAGPIKGDLRMFFDDFILKGRSDTNYAKWLRQVSIGRITLSYGPPLREMIESVISLPPNPFFAGCTWGFHDAVEHSLSKENTKFQWYRDRGLLIACEFGHLDIVSMLLKADPKGNVNERDQTGWTALHLAARNGHANIVKTLLEADPKANIDAQDKHGFTALHVALEGGHAEIIKILLEANPKANINVLDMGGFTALNLAILHGHAEIVKILLEANPDAQDKDGFTGLHGAALHGHAEIVKILLEADPKANINAEDNHGWTALHYAIRHRHVEIVNLLINALDKSELTPFQITNLPVRATYGADSQHGLLASHPDSDGSDLLASAFEYLILKYPNDSMLHSMLGNEYVYLERYGEASMAFDKSMYLRMEELKASQIEDIVTYKDCDECGVTIHGRHYKCIQCGPNYDLCQACLQKSNHKHPLTDFIMIPSEQFVADTD
jgi:ankyrin repeat protein